MPETLKYPWKGLPTVEEICAHFDLLLAYTPHSPEKARAVDACLERAKDLQMDFFANRAVDLLRHSDPERVFVKYSWWSRLVGKDLEQEVLYHAACFRIDRILEEGDVQAQAIVAFQRELVLLGEGVRREVEDLREYARRLEAALIRAEGEGLPEISAGFLDPDLVEALRRRRTNLEVQATALAQTALQAELVFQNTKHILERWDKLKHNVVPLWRENRVLHSAKKHMSSKAAGQLEKLTETLEARAKTPRSF